VEVARLEGASKKYKSGDTEVVALYPSDFTVSTGEMVIIMGPSGSGKTTLLSLLGCVIYPTEGRVHINDTYTEHLGDNALARLRLNSIGFVFQSFNLIAPLTVLENVMLPLTLQSVSRKEAKVRAIEALKFLGMDHRQSSLPKMLSGGEQQRAAISRALVTNAPLILCDEPTASLDAKSAVTVMEHLRELAVKGKAVVVVTHDQRLRPYADRIIEVSDGKVTNEIKQNVQKTA
jgi:putative ABC transport system ATP-binding protein